MTGPASRVGGNTRAVGAALLVAAFAAGVAVGIATTRAAAHQPQIKLVGADMAGILDKLDLTPQQRASANAIVERRAPSSEMMLLELGDRLRMVSDSLDAELRTILTPAQRIRLDSLASGRKVMLKRKLRGPGGGPLTDTVYPRHDTASRR